MILIDYLHLPVLLHISIVLAYSTSFKYPICNLRPLKNRCCLNQALSKNVERSHNYAQPFFCAKSSLDDLGVGAAAYKEWNVWKVIDTLENDGLNLSSKRNNVPDSVIKHELVQQVSKILLGWGGRWAGENEWQGILNKSSLLHEVEESIVALSLLIEFIEDRDYDEEPITIVDVCSGKGIFSLLSSYIFRKESRVAKIIMLDKAEIKWNHIDIVNSNAEAENRPIINAWQCNLHETDNIVNRLESIDSPKAIVGIHLCKTLSPAGIGTVNSLGTLHCPFFILAPCCMPRAVLRKNVGKKSVIEIRQFESYVERDARKSAQRRRDAAMTRKPPRRPTTMGENLNIDDQDAVMTPCWKCGMYGHLKADCPSTQTTGKPQLVKPRMTEIDVSNVISSTNPFDTYCSLIARTIQRDKVDIIDSGLDNGKNNHQKGNWNAKRKAIYIVAK